MKKWLYAIAVAPMLMPAASYAGRECQVVQYSTYENVRGMINGQWDRSSGSVYTERCVAATIQNTSGGGRLGAKIIATFADGNSRTKQVTPGTVRIDNGQQVPVTACWAADAPVVSADCDF